MNKVYIASDNMITSLGFTTSEHLTALQSNITGLKMGSFHAMSSFPAPFSVVDEETLESRFVEIIKEIHPQGVTSSYTKMEKMFIVSIHDALKNIDKSLFGADTILIISTTKGNIDLLDEVKGKLFDSDRVYLWRLGEVVRDFFGFKNTPEIVSNACISGVLAIGEAFRFLRSGLYTNAVVCGGDILSEFVISGFQSFQALSPDPCKPYDLNRSGLSLGEGCGTLVLTNDNSMIKGDPLIVKGMSTSNDANHISGPSRTGEELALAITQAMEEAGVNKSDIGFISAHGTATPFNDEMESKAIALCELNSVPLNSFKGYWGHTLGAAGVLESVAAINSMKQNVIIRSAGFEQLGVPEQINVAAANLSVNYSNLLKVASGFGGCNAAIIFGKDDK